MLDRARTAALLVFPAAALALLAGCLTGGDDIEREVRLVDTGLGEEQRGEDEYWMVWVRGNETEHREIQPVCSRLPPDYRIHRANRSLAYADDVYDVDPAETDVAVAFAHEDRSSGCPEVHGLTFSNETTREMGEYGELSLVVRADGTLVVDGREVPLGKAAQVRYEGEPANDRIDRVKGNFTVENLGAWPIQRLYPGR